jgi:hypothetical protein
MKNLLVRFTGVLLIGLILLIPTPVLASSGGFIDLLPMNTQVASTVPANGDVNPYGVAVVQQSVGALVKNDILVSNFNNSANSQGTGTTIVQVDPGGKVNLFATITPQDLPGACPGGVGLTTALVVLREGWVIVGSLPTSDGTSATAQAGCLIVLDAMGKVVETISGSPINGPWDMTAIERGHFAVLFVTNVLNGTVAGSPNEVDQGTVVRVVLALHGKHAPRVLNQTVIGSGFGERTDPGALVIGPTGDSLGKNGTLYVADTLANRITAIPNALFRRNSADTGKVISSGGGLNGPLGMTLAPNGDILTANAGDGNLVETTPGGKQVSVKMIDTTGTGAGTLFGLSLTPDRKGVYFVNDGNNTLNLLH